jgi:glutamate synthase domain-containing protein 2
MDHEPHQLQRQRAFQIRIAVKLDRMRSRRPQVKMVEIKLSQGAKPGQRGVPAPRLTAPQGRRIGTRCGSIMLIPIRSGV